MTNPQESTDLITFTEEIFNGKLHFLCSGYFTQSINHLQITEWVFPWPANVLCAGHIFFIKVLFGVYDTSSSKRKNQDCETSFK